MLSIDTPSIDILHDMSSFIDEPIADSSILPAYLISKMTREHVTVALGGDGGDELYGGYLHYQHTLRAMARLGWLPTKALASVAQFASRLPAGIRGRNWLTALRGGPSLSRVWGTPFFDLRLRRRLFSPAVLDELGDNFDAPEQRSLALANKFQDPIDSMSRMDFNQLLPDDYLVKVDRASMANSLEVRTPFLDHRLVEHALVRFLHFEVLDYGTASYKNYGYQSLTFGF